MTLLVVFWYHKRVLFDERTDTRPRHGPHVYGGGGEGRGGVVAAGTTLVGVADWYSVTRT